MAEEKKMVLQASGVSIVFGGLRAVSDFDCALYEGELVGEFDPHTTTVNELGLYMAGAKRQIAFGGKDK